MPISYQEPAQLTCPACGVDFSAALWLVLDAAEQPAVVEALLRGELNQVECPHCGNRGPAGAPLLFHDAHARRVIFAPTPDAAEHEIRDQARELHALLVGSIPEDQRRPYLADVDIAQDLDGMARRLQRMARRPGAAPVIPLVPAVPASADAPPAMLSAVQALLSANSADDLAQVMAAYPVLRDPATDAMLAALAEVAREQRTPDIAESLQQARQILAHMQVVVPPQVPPVAPSTLPLEALQALLNAATAVELAAVTTAHPLLLHPQSDTLLAERIEWALDEGNERLAQALEERREALAALRITVPAPEPIAELAPNIVDEVSLDEAIEALLLAEGEDALVAVIDRYPILLEESAADALWQFAAEARASGDEDLARYAVECRELLRRVRAGLSDDA